MSAGRELPPGALHSPTAYSRGVRGWALPEDFEALTPEEAGALQQELAGCVREEDEAGEPLLIAGVDAAYDARGGTAHGGAVLWSLAERRVVETAVASRPTLAPYRPGYLAWRELPAVLAALRRLRRRPDLVLVDGHGRAHPRRCGLACLLGLALELPTIGCGKSVLVGGCSGLGATRGSAAPLRDRGEVVGAAVRTRTGVRPVYVSVGHRVTLAGACALVLSTSRFRIPEPLRAADAAGRRRLARLA